MAGRAKSFTLVTGDSGEHIRTGTHGAADQYRLATVTKHLGKIVMPWRQGPGGAFAVDQQFAPLTSDLVRFLLAGIVGYIVEQP